MERMDIRFCPYRASKTQWDAGYPGCRSALPWAIRFCPFRADQKKRNQTKRINRTHLNTDAQLLIITLILGNLKRYWQTVPDSHIFACLLSWAPFGHTIDHPQRFGIERRIHTLQYF